MPSAINRLMVAELAQKFREMPNALLVDFTGLSAAQADALRNRLRDQGGAMIIVKNSLATRALAEVALGAAARLLVGPTAFVYGDDPVLLTKTIRDWGRKERALPWRGAIVEGEVVDPAGVDAIAELPPLPVLYAMVAGAIASPLTGFLGALQGILRSFVGTVKAIAEKQEQKA